MPKRHLDNVDINLLQEVGGKLTQRVRADLHGDARDLGCLLHRSMQLRRRYLSATAAREQPTIEHLSCDLVGIVPLGVASPAIRDFASTGFAVGVAPLLLDHLRAGAHGFSRFWCYLCRPRLPVRLVMPLCPEI